MRKDNQKHAWAKAEFHGHERAVEDASQLSAADTDREEAEEEERGRGADRTAIRMTPWWHTTRDPLLQIGPIA